MLDAIASRVAREHVAQLVTLFGQAGVGKSRLMAELLGRLPQARVLQGRCLPYGEGITYFSLGEAAKTEAAILDTDSAEAALEKLRTAIASVVAEPQTAGVVEAVAWTIGFEVPGSAIVTADPAYVRQALAEAWQRYIGALGRRQLTVLVVEDIHWASAALLDLLEQLAETLAETQVLILCTARPEFLDHRPTWGAGKQNATALTLVPLSPEESGRLVSSLLGEAHAPEDLRDQIQASAEGNPFFVEEMLQMLIEEGALERRNGGWAVTGRLSLIRIPDSVHGVIAARIDLLDASARSALRRCSVVGRVFWPAAVGVEDDDVAPLSRRGLVSPQPQSAMAGLREFAFKHALTRDVAYGSLPRPERRDLHRQVAEWIQRVAAGSRCRDGRARGLPLRRGDRLRRGRSGGHPPCLRHAARGRGSGHAARRLRGGSNAARACHRSGRRAGSAGGRLARPRRARRRGGALGRGGGRAGPRRRCAGGQSERALLGARIALDGCTG